MSATKVLDINNNVLNLMYMHDCVIIPGLGGFIANYHSAVISQNDHRFSPPRKEITFNKKLSSDDGLLINYLSQLHTISYKDVKKEVEKFVEEHQRKLSKGKVIHFEELGTLRLDKKGNFIFEAETQQNFLADSFGLPSFISPELEPIADDLTEKITVKPVVKKVVKGKLLPKVLIAVPIVLALAFLPSNFLKRQFNSDFNNSATIVSETLVSNPNTDYINNPESVDKAIDNLTSKRNALLYMEEQKTIAMVEKALEENKKPAIEKVVTKSVEKFTKPIEAPIETKIEKKHIKKFYLVGGSFAEIENAQFFVNKLKKQGYPEAEILPATKGRYRVSLKSYTKRTQANQGKRQLIEYGTWVLAF